MASEYRCAIDSLRLVGALFSLSPQIDHFAPLINIINQPLLKLTTVLTKSFDQMIISSFF